MSSLFSRALLVQGLTRCGRSPDHGRARSEDCIVSLTNGGPSCPQIVEKIQGTPVWPSRNDRHKQKSSAPQAFLVPTSARVPRRLDARLRGHDGLVKCGQYIIGAGPLEISTPRFGTDRGICAPMRAVSRFGPVVLYSRHARIREGSPALLAGGSCGRRVAHHLDLAAGPHRRSPCGARR